MYKVKLKCPDCEIPIVDKQVNVEQALVKCEHCEGVFSLGDEDFFNRRKPYVVIPRGIEAYQTLNTMEIDVRWRRASNLGFLTFFTLFWNFVVSVFVISAVLSGDFSMLYAIGIHLTIGVALAYWTMATYINHTSIFIEDGVLDVEYGPLPIPFWKRKRITTEELEQLFVERYQYGTSNGKAMYAFKVLAKVKKGKSKMLLVKGLKTLEHAQYIEQEIEHFLHIKDVAVGGEFG